MVLVFFVELVILLIMLNGKIDWKVFIGVVDIFINGKYEFQLSKFEVQLFGIWVDVFGYWSFGFQDSFFEVGGDFL